MAKLKLCLVGTELLNDEHDGRVLWTLDCVVCCCWFFFGLLLSGPVVGAPGFLCIFIRLVTVCCRKYMYKKRLSSLWPQANWVELFGNWKSIWIAFVWAATRRHTFSSCIRTIFTLIVLRRTTQKWNEIFDIYDREKDAHNAMQAQFRQSSIVRTE